MTAKPLAPKTYEAEFNGKTVRVTVPENEDPADAERIANHPMYSASDLAYLRRKGYGDAEILAFWGRDHAAGNKPVYHAKATEAMQDAIRDNLSPQAVAIIVQVLRQRVDSDRHDSPRWKATIAHAAGSPNSSWRPSAARTATEWRSRTSRHRQLLPSRRLALGRRVRGTNRQEFVP